MIYDYYYGDESSQFSFYRIPRQLITGQHFKKVSTDAKLLYGLLLDRMGLSARNGWYDDAGRVYIFYTLDEIQEDLSCGHEKAVKLLSELDADKGCGLIERVKQGQGRPAKIYVKRFTTRQITAESLAPQELPRLPKIGSQEVGKSEVKASEKQKSRLPVFRSADFGKSDGNYIESNQTDFSYKNQSIHPSITFRFLHRYPDNFHAGIVCGRAEDGSLLVIHCASGYNNVVITGTDGFAVAARPGCFSGH